MRAWMIVLVLPVAGCLRNTSYTCTTSSQCGTDGVCEMVGYCSFPDATCGRRFGPQAGTYANQCVGGIIVDAGIDTPSGCGSSKCDAPPDSVPTTCPSDFTSPSGAPPGHSYKRIATAADWPTQKAACAAFSTRAVLGFPSSQAELVAMSTLAAGADYWVGIDDLPPATTWVNTRGMNQTFLPWDQGQPNNSPMDQCVEVLQANATINNTRCNTTLAAICECE
jgi:hypothetical protein